MARASDGGKHDGRGKARTRAGKDNGRVCATFVYVKVGGREADDARIMTIIDDRERSDRGAEGVAQRDVLTAQEELVGAAGIGQLHQGVNIAAQTAVLDGQGNNARRETGTRRGHKCP